MKNRIHSRFKGLIALLVFPIFFGCGGIISQEENKNNFSSSDARFSKNNDAFVQISWNGSTLGEQLSLVNNAKMSLMGKVGGGVACWGSDVSPNSISLDGLKIRRGALGCEICIEKITVQEQSGNSKTLSINPGATLCKQSDSAYFSNNESINNTLSAFVTYKQALDSSAPIPNSVDLAVELKFASSGGVQASAWQCLPGTIETKVSFNIAAETASQPELKCTEITSNRECNNGTFGEWIPKPTEHLTCTPLSPQPQPPPPPQPPTPSPTQGPITTQMISCDNPALVREEVVTVVIPKNNPKKGGKSCPFGRKGNLEITNESSGKYTARIEREFPISIPSGRQICSMRASSEEQTMRYDDHFFLTLNGYVLVSSRGIPTGKFKKGSNGFHVYKWKKIKGKKSDGNGTQCAEGTYCEVPKSEHRGKFSFSMSDEANKRLFSSLANQSLKFGMIITGDDNPESDCAMNRDLNLAVTYTYVEDPKTGTVNTQSVTDNKKVKKKKEKEEERAKKKAERDEKKAKEAKEKERKKAERQEKKEKEKKEREREREEREKKKAEKEEKKIKEKEEREAKKTKEKEEKEARKTKEKEEKEAKKAKEKEEREVKKAKEKEEREAKKAKEKEEREVKKAEKEEKKNKEKEEKEKKKKNKK